MNYLVLIAAIALLAIWVIALFTGGVATWFLWLVFAAAVVLFLTGATNVGTTKRKISKPV